jgi:SAM-dependent methyltransferase
MTEDDRIERNRRLWAHVNAELTDEDASARWAFDEILWGMTATPEASLGVLGDVDGLDVLDLGCGTGYFSAWLTRRGARLTAVDLSPEQLATALRCQQEFGVRFDLVEANAESLPLPDGSFDLVLSEHGVGVWCQPDAWVAEAARVLRPGGRLVFLVNSLISALCVPAEGGDAGERLLRGQPDVCEVTWPGGGTEFHLSHGQWIDVLRRHGFAIEALHELYTDPSGSKHRKYADYLGIASEEWGSRWPVEELWEARRPLRVQRRIASI